MISKQVKKSRYSYEYIDSKGDLLLCNFVKGSDSFCKVKKHDIEKFRKIMSGDIIIYNEDHRNYEAINELISKGYLINTEVDELQVIKALYYESVMNEWLSLTIMPTEKCNFRCKYCYETYTNGEMTTSSQKILLKFIQKQLYSCSKVSISWFGGEPLLSKNVIYYIMKNVKLMCEKRNVSFVSNMTTNGYLLDIDTLRKLYELNVIGYQITIDGLEDQHNK